jgi:hypothetical protein
MTSCPHCQGILVDTLGGYYRCLNPDCGRLLDLVDPVGRDEENAKRGVPLPEDDEVSFVT